MTGIELIAAERALQIEEWWATMTGLIILAALAFIAIAARVLRRVIKRRNHGFPASRKRSRETYMNWICGRN